MMLTRSTQVAFGSKRTSCVSRRSTVRVQAAAPNVQEARSWIGAWKTKQAAQKNRPNWFPGTEQPDYLDGSLPGDFGFDPLRLGEDAAKLEWYVQAELQNGRWAMLGVAGILGPEVFTNLGIQWAGAGVPWYEAGAFPYFASPLALIGVQVLLFTWVEARRYQDMRKPGSANQDPIFAQNRLPDGNTPGYPGGIFDPFGWSKKGPEQFQSLKVKEIKNARLAMLAFAGFVAQHYTTGTTPLTNLSDHLADPWNSTVWQNDLARLH